MAKSVCQKSLASIMIDAGECSWDDRGATSSSIWTVPELRASASQAGVPDVRAWFISPNRKEPPALLATSLLTTRGGSHRNGKYAVTMSRSTTPRSAARHAALVLPRSRGITTRTHFRSGHRHARPDRTPTALATPVILADLNPQTPPNRISRLTSLHPHGAPRLPTMRGSRHRRGDARACRLPTVEQVVRLDSARWRGSRRPAEPRPVSPAGRTGRGSLGPCRPTSCP